MMELTTKDHQKSKENLLHQKDSTPHDINVDVLSSMDIISEQIYFQILILNLMKPTQINTSKTISKQEEEQAIILKYMQHGFISTFQGKNFKKERLKRRQFIKPYKN